MSINADLKRIYKDFSNAYGIVCEESWKTHVTGLKPGSPTPPKGKIYGAADQKRFAEIANEHKAKALKILNEERDRLVYNAGRGPSNEATNAVQMLALNPSPTTRDFEVIAETYGDNILVMNALRGIARKHEIPLTIKNPKLDKLDAINKLRESFETNTFSPDAMSERGPAWDFMIERGIDAAFEP